MEIFPEFPPDRLSDPTRRAEQRLYDQLEQSEVPGYVLYEAKPNRKQPQLDFAIWMQDIARVAAQCKGGIYELDRGKWYLHSIRGREPQDSPVFQAWDAGMAMRATIERRIGRGVFVIVVLVFPDMKHDPVISNHAMDHNVSVVFGHENLVDQLIDLTAKYGVKYPPTAEQIQEEVEVIMPVLGKPAKADQPPQIIIQHVETINFHVTPGGIQSDLGGLAPTE